MVFPSADTTAVSAKNIASSPPLRQRIGSWFLADGLYWLHAVALFAFAAFVSFSIAGAHISLGLLTLCVALQIAKSKRQKASSKKQKPSIRLGIEWTTITFGVIAIISTVLSEVPAESFRNMKHLLTILGAYTVAYSLRWYPQWRRPLLWTFVGTATAASLFGLGKFAFGFSSKVWSTQSISMTWGALSVMFIAVTLQVAFSAPFRRDRWLARAQSIPQIFAMLLSFVRGAYVGFAVSVIYLLREYWTNRRVLWRRLVPALAIIILATLLFSPASVRQRVAAIFDLKVPSTQVRLVQWKYAFEIAADNPVFGVGWRDMLPLVRQYVPPDIEVPESVKHDVFHIGHFHNAYVMVLVCFGVAGLVAFLWLLVAVWRQLGITSTHADAAYDRLIIFASRAAMVGLLVTSMVDWTFGDAEVVTMFWFLIGMGLGQIGWFDPATQTAQTTNVANREDR